jgi:hypothetical protein
LALLILHGGKVEVNHFNSRKFTPLLLAVKDNQVDSVLTLLQKGKEGRRRKERDEEGRTEGGE